MVASTVPDKAPRRGRYYVPGPITENVPGVVRKRLDVDRDLFTGEAEALTACGVVRADMLPPPGVGKIAWRPAGGQKPKGGSWWAAPGYLEVRRLSDGARFAVERTVSREERAARRCEVEEREKPAASAPAAPSSLASIMWTTLR